MKHFVCWSIVLLAAIAPALLATEVPSAADSQSTVPELLAFHEVIVPIWHTAYPAKDIAALKGLKAQVNAGAEKIFGAELPGILREKAAAWQQGLTDFRGAVEAYNRAADADRGDDLLAAAEALHARYEKLIRIIRPVLKEVGVYHQTLYVIYHRDLPAKATERIAAAADELVAQAEAIEKAALPKRLEAKTAEFAAAAGTLTAASRELKAACAAGEPAKVAAAVERVHSVYQALEKVFD
ncbi:MAG TPA: hypothetical protein PKK12_00900 [Candidatus Aminicenantes bacterium]|nr:hypothetical protein [Candidatus Aminicenantes bacterium]